MHNFPEGLAIGSGFDQSVKLGFSLALTLMFHDIPEGVALAVPMIAGGKSRVKTVLIAAGAGIPMGIGALVGALAGHISETVISLCLSIAAGAMLYVVMSDLIPQSKKMYEGRLSSFCDILGILTGVIISVGLG
jgi:ZIP family zinc transporter